MVGFFARNWSFNPLEGVKDAELQGVVALTVALHVVLFCLSSLQVYYVHDGVSFRLVCFRSNHQPLAFEAEGIFRNI